MTCYYLILPPEGRRTRKKFTMSEPESPVLLSGEVSKEHDPVV